MKLCLIAGILSASLFTSVAATVEAGPKGGRLLGKTQPKAEFLVEKDRTVSIRFYNAESKPVAATEQSVVVIADVQGNKHKLEFEKQGDILMSKSKLPDGEGYGLVVQLREKPDAKPQNYRFKFEMYDCGGCKRVEYACACHE